jgi:hypothetical protein
MTIIFSKISEIFSNLIKTPNAEGVYEDNAQKLIYRLIKTNKTLWDLEDSARLFELGDSHVAEAKKDIDIYNQQRNDLIREIDALLYERFNVSRAGKESFYSESPGMIIDRLSIIFIKLFVVRQLISLIEKADLKSEYFEKEKLLLSQIENIGNFLDLYIERLIKKEVFFEIQQAVKIYNDKRVKKYIDVINLNK